MRHRLITALAEPFPVVVGAVDLLQISIVRDAQPEKVRVRRHSFAQPIGGHGAVRPRLVRSYSLKGDASEGVACR